MWPQSLYGQILAVTALALLVAQGFGAVMLLSGTYNRSVAESAAMIVTRVANQIERGNSIEMAAGNSESYNSRRSDRPRRRRTPVIITVDAEPLTVARSALMQDFTARADEFFQGEVDLRNIRIATMAISLLPPDRRNTHLRRWQAVRIRRPDQRIPQHAVLFTAQLPDGRWINATATIRPTDTASIMALLIQTLILYAAVMIPLALVARRIAKPLNSLTERVQRVGLGGEVNPLSAHGPEDIRLLIEAFNNMQSRVSTLLGEKDVMLGAIGHDLKTPLAALRVRIESVEDDDDREKMAASIDEMVTILDDILMLARMGKSGEALQSVDIGALVESVSSEFDAASFNPPETRCVAVVRPVLLRRALRNLVGNAVLYGNHADVSLTQDSTDIAIAIADHGPGIDPSLIDSIFEPFTRADTSRSRSTGGSGLGLTIARAIARSHGGDVSLKNRKDGGLIAVMTLKN